MNKKKTSFSALEQRIYNLLAQAGDAGMSMQEIIKAVYKKRRDGGPITADRGVKTLIKRINDKINSKGLAIVSIPRAGTAARRYLFDEEKIREKRADFHQGSLWLGRLCSSRDGVSSDHRN